MVHSEEPAATLLSSGANATQFSQPLATRVELSSFPSIAAHTFTVPSSDEDASILPSALYAQEVVGLGWDPRGVINLAAPTSHKHTVLSTPELTICLPLGEN